MQTGSPPQVRGKPILFAKGGQGMRITPAGAGKTSGIGILGLFIEDHPRRCGENRGHIDYLSVNTGSPPQVRGKLWMSIAALIVYGITPAGAGKTGVPADSVYEG